MIFFFFFYNDPPPPDLSPLPPPPPLPPRGRGGAPPPADDEQGHHSCNDGGNEDPRAGPRRLGRLVRPPQGDRRRNISLPPLAFQLRSIRAQRSVEGAVDFPDLKMKAVALKRDSIHRHVLSSPVRTIQGRSERP